MNKQIISDPSKTKSTKGFTKKQKGRTENNQEIEKIHRYKTSAEES